MMITAPKPSSKYEADDAVHSVQQDASTYPEGGLQAWMVVLGAWCAMISSMGLLNTLAVLQAWVSEHQLHGMPESAVGWIFSTYSFFLYFCGAQIGRSLPKTPQLDDLVMASNLLASRHRAAV